MQEINATNMLFDLIDFFKDNLVYYRRCILNTHIFRKDNSVGFNEQVISFVKPDFLYVKNMENRKRFKISKEKFKQTEIFLHFKKHGFEKQVFVRLSDMESLN